MSHYPLEVFWSEEDEGYIAEAPDLPGCSAFGRDKGEAVAEAQDAIASWLEAARAAGREIPLPAAVAPLNAFSGKLVVRFGRTLHAQLARRAQLDGLSLNQCVLRLVSANLATDLTARIPADVHARAMERVSERVRSAAGTFVDKATAHQVGRPAASGKAARKRPAAQTKRAATSSRTKNKADAP